MPNESDAAENPLQVPLHLKPDHRILARALIPWLERVPDTNWLNVPSYDVFRLLTEFGLLVHEEALQHSVIASGDRSRIYSRHVLDSLNPVTLFHVPPRSLLDVGSGGGFPGIPLAIAWPGTQITLLESRKKRAGFLEKAVRELGLRNVTVICARLEEFGSAWSAGGQEAACMRAVGGLSNLLRNLVTICAHQALWIYFLGRGTSKDYVFDGLGPFGDGATTVTGEFGGRMLFGKFPSEPLL